MPVEPSDTMKIWHFRSVPTATEPDIHVTSYDVDQVRAWIRANTSGPAAVISQGDLDAGLVSFLTGFLLAALEGPDDALAAAIADGRRAEIAAGKKPRQIEITEPN